MARDSGIPTGNRGPASDLRGRVRQELDKLKGLAERVSLEEIRQGDWFPELLKFSLDQYVQDVDAEYFTRLYPGLSPQAMVAARIDLAARYASIEGALMAGSTTARSRQLSAPVVPLQP